MVAITLVDPEPVIVTFDTKRGVGVPPAFPYVTVPLIVGANRVMLPFVTTLLGVPSLNANAGWKMLAGSVKSSNVNAVAWPDVPTIVNFRFINVPDPARSVP